MSTHTIAVFYLGLFILALWTLRRRLGWSNMFACMFMPVAIFAIFWLGTFGERGLEAIRNHHELANIMGGAGKPATASADYLKIAIHDSSVQAEFLQAGGTTAIVILATFALFVLRLVTRWPRRVGDWLVLTAALLGQAYLIRYKTSLGIASCYIYFPFTALMIGIIVTRWRPILRRCAVIGVVLLACLEFAQTGYILYGTHRDYALRAPGRHDELMNRLAKYERVGVLPALWYQARSHGLNFRLIDLSISKQREEWQNNPHAFDEFDAVVLRAGNPLCDSPQLKRITPEEIPEPMARFGLLLYELRPPKK